MPRSTSIQVNTFGAGALTIMRAACAPAAHETRKSRGNNWSGQVSGVSIDAPIPERHEAQPGVHHDQPAAFLENPEPVYPSALPSQRLPPATIRIRVVVDADGRVALVQPLDMLDENQEQFYSAVEPAVSKWRFFPLVKTTEGPDQSSVTVDGVTTTYQGNSVTLPFHQDYAFLFRQVDGKGVVNVQ